MFTKQNADENKEIQARAMKLMAGLNEDELWTRQKGITDELAKEFPAVNWGRIRGHVAKTARIIRGKIAMGVRNDD